jgi:hypothetical protein
MWNERQRVGHGQRELFERSDGAYVMYDERAAGTTSRPWRPGHRGWVAFGPDGSYLGYFPSLRVRRGVSRMRVPLKFKTAHSAMAALDRLRPIGRKWSSAPARPR